MTGVKEFLWPVRVYYEDTDSGGVVYYANYLKFMERARTEWLRQLGFEQDELREKEGVLFAVRRAGVDFRSPARFNDALQVSVQLISRGKASLVFRQDVRLAVDGRVLCHGEIKIACLDAASFRPVPIPQALFSVIHDDV
ncbi:tol-pal system-associated acyl-CoA thioesterase [Sedimenticola thiotaurini]|uniref:tol-pal system-associated acyl-CoA thioesterase n=1 Tax=Sedimenticola thiotaurini TaxID=1543721 RepID=UPI000B125A2D